MHLSTSDPHLSLITVQVNPVLASVQPQHCIAKFNRAMYTYTVPVLESDGPTAEL